MPHLSKIAKDYSGKVTVIAVSDEDVSTVETFLAKDSTVDGKTWGEAMEFTVATDPDKSVKEAIFTAAGQRGIPSSFIIKGGVVQWIGHPMSMDDPLAKVVKGEYDLAKAKKEFAEGQAAQKILTGLRPKIGEAQSSGDWKPVITALDEALAKFPSNKRLLMTKWQLLVFGAKKEKDAYAMGKSLLAAFHDDATGLNQLAWTIVDDKNLKTRDLDLAMKAAQRARDLTKGEDGAILDTLARVHFMKGNVEKAIEIQRKAISHATGQLKEQLQKVLEEYEAAADKKADL